MNYGHGIRPHSLGRRLRRSLHGRVSATQFRHHQALDQASRAAFEIASRIQLDLEALREGVEWTVRGQQLAGHVYHAVGTHQTMPLVRSAVVESSQFRVLARVAQVRGGPLEKRIRSVVRCRPSLAPGTRVGAKGAESCSVDGSVSHELARSPASAFENKLGVHIRGNEVP